MGRDEPLAGGGHQRMDDAFNLFQRARISRDPVLERGAVNGTVFQRLWAKLRKRMGGT